MTNIPGKPFTDVLGEIEDGAFLRDLTEAVYNIMAAVQEVRKPGSLTVKLAFAPSGRALCEIAAAFDAKEPRHDRVSTTFFVGSDFSLHRHDPSQPRLPLREVETVRGDIKKMEG